MSDTDFQPRGDQLTSPAPKTALPLAGAGILSPSEELPLTKAEVHAVLRSANGNDLTITGLAPVQPVAESTGAATADAPAQPVEREKPNAEAQASVQAMQTDITVGERWSDKSKAAWQHIFAEAQANALKRPGHEASIIAGTLNSVGAALNAAVGEPRVGMAMKEDADGTHFIMMLSKDAAALAKNKIDLVIGNTSPTIVEVGVFKPGTPIEPHLVG